MTTARKSAAKAESAEKNVESEVQTHAPASLKKPSGKLVKHHPMDLFSARVIRKEHWASIGIFDQEGVEWNESNHFRLPVEMFSDAAMNYLLNQDDGFEIVSS